MRTALLVRIEMQDSAESHTSVYHDRMNARSGQQGINRLVESGCLGGDPLPWILDSGEPIAVWQTLTGVLDLPEDASEVKAAHARVVEDQAVRSLVSAVVQTRATPLVRHDDSLYLPGRLRLLADFGVARGEFAELDTLLEGLLGEQERGMRSASPAAVRPKPDAGSRYCDAVPMAAALLRFGLGGDDRSVRAVTTALRGIVRTSDAAGWRCVPERRGMLALARRGPVCPQLQVEGLRLASLLPESQRPATVRLVRAQLGAWRMRAEMRPYGFGHGYQFKTVRWPSLWYDALAVVDAVGRFAEAFAGDDALADRQALAEIAACLIAYNVGVDGRVTPVRVYPGYPDFSFGRKDGPSPFATVRVLSTLVRIADLAEEIAAVDVSGLASSRGGRAVPTPPHAMPSGIAGTCVAPTTIQYPRKYALPRLLVRQHLDLPWEGQSPETVTGDVVALSAGRSAWPYLSMAARLPGFRPEDLDDILDGRRSLVRLRAMRGVLYAVRRDFVAAVHAASSRQVVKTARRFALERGVDPAEYERVAPHVMAASEDEPLTLREIRGRVDTDVDLGAVVTLLAAERELLVCGPREGRFGQQTTYRTFAAALPDVDLAINSEDEGRVQLLRAYVRGFGPVTHRDAAWWTGMDLKRVSRALSALDEEIVEVAVEGHEDTLLMHAADVEELERTTLMARPAVSLLPANDPLLVGYTDRSRFVDDSVRPFVFDAAGNAAPVVIVDGRVHAVWDIVRSGDTGGDGVREVCLFPLAPLVTEVADAIEQQAAVVGTVLGDARGVRYVTGMRPLTARPLGAFAHPLR